MMKKGEYVKTLHICGKEVKVGFDDYGQNYFIEYEENGEIREESFSSFDSSYVDCAYYRFDPVYRELERKSLYGEISECEKEQLQKYHSLFSDLSRE